MNKKLPSLKINVILNIIRTLMTIIFPLITYPYATRLLQAENLGKVNFASSTINYFSLIAVLGLTSYAAREGTKYRDNKKQLNQFCNELLTLNFITTIIAYVLLIIAISVSSKLQAYGGLLAIYSITILFSTLGMEWLYTLHEDFKYITIRSIAMQIVSMILLLLLVKEQNDFYIYASINVFANVGGNIFNFIHARKYIKPSLVLNKKIFTHLKYSIIFFSNSIASSIYSNIDTTMLGVMCGNYYVGVYAVSVKIYTMVKSILVAVMSVTSPRLNYYRMNNMLLEFNQVLTKLVKMMITLMLPVVVGINITANEIVLIISGDGYTDSVMPLKILSIAILGSIFASITSNILVAYRKEKIVLRGTISAAIINALCNIVVIPIFKQNGAAATTVLAEFVVLGIGGWNSRKLVKLDNMRKVMVSSIIGCLAMIITGLGIEHFVDNMIISLCAKVILCAVVYVIALIFMRNEIVIEYGYGLLKKNKK